MVDTKTFISKFSNSNTSLTSVMVPNSDRASEAVVMHKPVEGFRMDVASHDVQVDELLH